jgi:hypothetical protein
MKVLNRVEREAFESPPLFNSAERKRCCDFPRAIQEIAAGLRSATNQLCCDLQFLAERAGLLADAVNFCRLRQADAGAPSNGNPGFLWVSPVQTAWPHHTRRRYRAPGQNTGQA